MPKPQTRKDYDFVVLFLLFTKSKIYIKDNPLLKFKKIIKPYLLKKEIHVGLGKKVFEVKPMTGWDKGKAVLWILKKQQVALGNAKIVPLSIGDDATDEDVFFALRDKGLTIYVGEPKQSYAQYYLRDIDEAARFLFTFAQQMDRKKRMNDYVG